MVKNSKPSPHRSPSDGVGAFAGAECFLGAFRAHGQKVWPRFGPKDDRIAARTDSAGPVDHVKLPM